MLLGMLMTPLVSSRDHGWIYTSFYLNCIGDMERHPAGANMGSGSHSGQADSWRGLGNSLVERGACHHISAYAVLVPNLERRDESMTVGSCYSCRFP